MKTEDIFPSRFLQPEQLAHDVAVVIEKVVKEEVYDEKSKSKVMKPICYCQGKGKGVLLNKTNWHTLVDAFGDESDGWVGKKMILTSIEVEAFGDVVKAIRIKIPNGG